MAVCQRTTLPSLLGRCACSSSSLPTPSSSSSSREVPHLQRVSHAAAPPRPERLRKGNFYWRCNKTELRKREKPHGLTAESSHLCSRAVSSSCTLASSHTHTHTHTPTHTHTICLCARPCLWRGEGGDWKRLSALSFSIPHFPLSVSQTLAAEQQLHLEKKPESLKPPTPQNLLD